MNIPEENAESISNACQKGFPVIEKIKMINIQGCAGAEGHSNPVHLPPTGQNGYGETVGCGCDKCIPNDNITRLTKGI